MSILDLLPDLLTDKHLPTVTRDTCRELSCSLQLQIKNCLILLLSEQAGSLSYDRQKYLLAEMLE